jgi:hypothetical protein
MANKHARGKCGAYNFAPTVRAQFLRAIEIYKKRTGKSFADVLADVLERDPLGTSNAIAKFTVRESKVDASGSVELEVRGSPAPNRTFAEILAERPIEQLQDTSEHSPVLPALVGPEETCVLNHQADGESS